MWEFLAIATNTTKEVCDSNDELARYIIHFDRGLVALVDDNDRHRRPVGAAWTVRWNETVRGYGYVSESLPELAIGILPAYQSRGIGTRILQELLHLCQEKDDHRGMSLSVHSDNVAARKLYEHHGF